VQTGAFILHYSLLEMLAKRFEELEAK